MNRNGNSLGAKLFFSTALVAVIFGVAYLGQGISQWQGDWVSESQAAAVGESLADKFFCTIGGWLGFSCEEEVVFVPAPTQDEYIPSVVVTPASTSTTVVQNVTNEYITRPVERETVREVVIQNGAVDFSRFLTREEYDNQVEALLTSIENIDTNSSGGGSGIADISGESLEDLADVASMSQSTGDLFTWNGSEWTNIATSSLGMVGSQWTTSGSDIYYESGSVGIGTDSPTARLTVATPATFGAELVTNGTFTGDASGWTLQSGCSAYDNNNATVLYNSTCENDASDASLSTSVSLVSGTTYVLTFDITANGDQMSVDFSNMSSTFFGGPFSTGAHSITFTSDYTGNDTVTFSSWDWLDDSGWTIDNVSLRSTDYEDLPIFAAKDVTGATTTLFGLLNNNLAIGRGALNHVTASNMIGVGYGAGFNATDARESNFLGYQAGAGATNANNSNFFGFGAGVSATNANESNFLGLNAGYQATNAENSNFLGPNAGYLATGAYESSFIGSSAGQLATNANESNFLGLNAGYQATEANNSNFFGNAAGYRATNAFRSNFIGYSAGQDATNAAYSIFIGYEAGYSDTVNNLGSASSSIAIGRRSGTGGFSDSIAIGHGVINSAARQLNIGNILYATGLYASDTKTATAQANGRVGIGTSTTSSRLTVAGESGVAYAMTLALAANASGGVNLTSPDVVHGMTNLTTTNTFLEIGSNGTQGGGRIVGYSDDPSGVGLWMRGVIGSATPDSSTPAILLSATKKNSTIAQALGTNEMALQLYNFSTPVLTVLGSGNLGLGTTTPSSKLTVAGDLRLTGAFKDSLNATGTLGQLLWSTGTSTLWVSTSSLGISGGPSLFTENGSTTYLSSTTANLALGATTTNVKLEVVGDIVSKGTSWTARSAAGDNDMWTDVAYGNGLFVAVGQSGDRVMYSSDGINWATTTAAGNNGSWVDITYGNGLFVALSDTNDRVMYSSDGINWATTTAAGNNDTWWAITYGNGTFVAVGGSTDRVMTSPDGINWTARSAAGDNDFWRDVTYAKGLFIAVGASGDRVMTSPDGINWTARSAAGDNDSWNSVTYGNGLFVAVSQSSDAVMYSSDGINWATTTAAGNNDSWQTVTYGNGLFVALGAFSGDRVMTSPDGINWTARSAAGDNDAWSGVTYANGIFVAVGSGGDYVMTSGKLEETTVAHNNLYQGGLNVLGRMGISTTTPSSNYALHAERTSSSGGVLRLDVLNTNTAMADFVYNGSTVGYISTNGSSVTYNTTSDRRRKENINDTTLGLDTLLSLPVRDFSYVNDESHEITTGFIAQELYEVFPWAVTTNGDDGTVDLLGDVKPWSVDYGRITPLLVKSIQDLNYKLEDLATTTALTDQNSFTKRFFDNLIAWFANAANGIGTMVASVFQASEMICVDNECLTADDIRLLKENNNIESESEEEENLPSPILGCMDMGALNYLPEATEDDGSCQYEEVTGEEEENLELETPEEEPAPEEVEEEVPPVEPESV